ncbi:PREDICTED: uncharacterized protein LOC109340042 [Lupinus angustifolius]|uniref:uncharacterized protein LOC109340042 n=1 Tax=Lupinus angustifolius TaxID=3871 RepID=UPI00092F5211|nr:PREDICTED: uncharacterized protein LOC109340042 [Lupinus angustifolius]
MPTFNQLIRHGREEKRRTDRTRASDQCPQKKGVGPRLSTRTPKKPNSAPRKIAILVFLLFIVFAVTYLVCILLGLDWTIFVVKVQSMLLVRSFRLLFIRLIGEAVGPGTLILLLCILSSLGGYTYYNMEDPARGEGGSGAGPSQRRGHIDLNLPPGSGDELSDLVAELDQVEREIRRLSESRIESTEGLEARQTKLARLKTVLDGVESRLDQAREIDRVRDNERARLREEMYYDYHRWGTLEQENARMRFKVNELTLNKR